MDSRKGGGRMDFHAGEGARKILMLAIGGGQCPAGCADRAAWPAVHPLDPTRLNPHFRRGGILVFVVSAPLCRFDGGQL